MDAIITAKVIWKNVCTPAELKKTGETLSQMVRRHIKDYGLDTADCPIEIIAIEQTSLRGRG